MLGFRILALAASMVLLSCQPTTEDPVAPDPQETGPVAAVYTTSVAGQRMAESQIPLGKPEETHFYKVERTGKSFQTVDGFGLAITQASCCNLLLMPPEERTAFLTEIFSREEGLGSSLIRVCIGGSDFSMDEFTWCDRKGIENFDVHPLDEEYLFPILDQIFRINPSVKIIGSPWSCPKWMKMTENGKAD
ncbi:MAG: glucosylceramidase, partial [Bacteroidales bacterium]|nr:glucosylceramidase [Bacteroidales bacterium]